MGFPATFPSTFPNGAGGPVSASAGLASGTGSAPGPSVPLPPFTVTPTDLQPVLNYTQFGTSPSNAVSPSGCTNSIVTIVSGGTLQDVGGASASSPNGTSPAIASLPYTFWADLANPAGGNGWQSTRWQVRPDLTPAATAGYYRANQSILEAVGGSEGNGWYAGLLSGSTFSGGSRIALFSIWNAVGAVVGDIAGSVAQTFGDEGDGWQVIAPYAFVDGQVYSFQCSAEPSRGARWFSCHIKDETSGVVVRLGSIQANTSDSGLIFGRSYQWTELYAQTSPAATCPLLPRATTFFSKPIFSSTPVLSGGAASALAGVAAGTGSAPQPTVAIPGQANAGLASGTGAALQATTTGAGGLVAAGFDGVRWPKLIVQAGIGVAGAMVNISADSAGSQSILSFSRSFGRSSPLDSCDVGTATVVFDNRSGDYDPMNASGAYTALDVGVAVQVLAEFPIGTLWDRFTGTITDIQTDVDTGPLPLVTLTCADGLEQLGRTQLPAGITTFPTWYTGERIYDLADLAGWSGGRAIDTGIIQLGFPQELGSTVLDLMQQVEMTEMGLLFVAEDGTLTYWDRHHHQIASRSLNTQLTLADGAGATVVRMAELSFSRNRDLVFNDIHMTRDPDPSQDPELTLTEPGDEPREITVADATSITSYGHLNLPADVGKLHSNDNAVKDQANMLLARYKAITDRVEQVTINALHPKVKTNNLWDELLALTLLDRVSVSRTYRAGVTLSATLHVQAISEEVTASPPGWNLTLTTAGVPPTINRFILGTSTLGTNSIGW